MDLLGQYNANNPDKSADASSPVDLKGQSFLIKLAFKLSGGAVRDMRQANYVLAGVAVLFVIGSIIALVWGQVL